MVNLILDESPTLFLFRLLSISVCVRVCANFLSFCPFRCDSFIIIIYHGEFGEVEGRPKFVDDRIFAQHSQRFMYKRTHTHIYKYNMYTCACIG